MTDGTKQQTELKRTNGWDERDYKLWSDVEGLPSYGLIAPNDRMISLKQVVELMKKHAEKRFDEEWKATDSRKRKWLSGLGCWSGGEK